MRRRETGGGVEDVGREECREEEEGGALCTMILKPNQALAQVVSINTCTNRHAAPGAPSCPLSHNAAEGGVLSHPLTKYPLHIQGPSSLPPHPIPRGSQYSTSNSTARAHSAQSWLAHTHTSKCDLTTKSACHACAR